MGELTQELRHRLDAALASLRDAEAGDDDFLADIRRSEIADLRRIARENGVADLDVSDGPCDLRAAV